jgi:hypothetical protein
MHMAVRERLEARLKHETSRAARMQVRMDVSLADVIAWDICSAGLSQMQHLA